MPEFFFKIVEGEEIEQVADGFEMANVSEAKQVAIAALVEEMNSRMPWPPSSATKIEVQDESRSAMFTAKLTLEIEDVQQEKSLLICSVVQEAEPPMAPNPKGPVRLPE
ncbi:hypothetical protein AB4Z52_09185 [Rhizobium sp. 2YAF20]|uniref:DUF6894 family protein n=1 Tax=Rhizobium sp. 2YAF20 TaxID=3233027 RepID=UPI003F9D4930